MPAVGVPKKWRPSLALLTLGLCLVLIILPIVGVLMARLTQNQFVRETEGALLSQAALFAEAYALEFERAEPAPDWGHELSAAQVKAREKRWQPFEPRLQHRTSNIEAPRPEGLVGAATRPAYNGIAQALNRLASGAQRHTLAGFRALDDQGTVVAGTAEIGLSLSAIAEVQSALQGRVSTVMRYRNDGAPAHTIASISRDTTFRVYVAAPVIVNDRVVGAVYLARTPISLRKFMARERSALIYVGLAVLLATLIAGGVFWRVIFSPLSALERQSRQIASGERTVAEPIRRYGLKETANLGRSMLSMADALTSRADTVETYTTHVTHELKSPVTAIIAAAELLEQETTSARGQKLVSNISSDGRRIEALLDRLRELAQAKNMTEPQTCRLLDVLDQLRSDWPDLEIAHRGRDLALPMSAESAGMILGHLALNASEHGATKIVIATDDTVRGLVVSDDGVGIKPENFGKILDPFFTTRRDDGGTGMGLAIVEALLAGSGGQISVVPHEGGARFLIAFEPIDAPD